MVSFILMDIYVPMIPTCKGQNLLAALSLPDLDQLFTGGGPPGGISSPLFASLSPGKRNSHLINHL